MAPHNGTGLRRLGVSVGSLSLLKFTYQVLNHSFGPFGTRNVSKFGSFNFNDLPRSGAGRGFGFIKVPFNLGVDESHPPKKTKKNTPNPLEHPETMVFFVEVLHKFYTYN